MRFRVWDKVEKEYLHHCFIDNNGELYLHCDTEEGELQLIPEDEMGRYSIEESTGKTDCKDQEIFENDKVVLYKIAERIMIKHDNGFMLIDAYENPRPKINVSNRLESLEVIGVSREPQGPAGRGE